MARMLQPSWAATSTCNIIIGHTFLAGLAVVPLQEQELGGLGQEGQRDELEQSCKTVEAEQPGPAVRRPQQLTATKQAPQLLTASTQ